MPDQFHVEEGSGVRIPTDLTGSLAGVEEIVPNTWNPNKMEGFMRDKLRNAIRKDGFIVPIIVRPIEASSRADRDQLIERGVKWEIVDGEHRWVEGQELAMQRFPVVNVGRISDTDAKQITVKANALRGDFDSVKLAEMVADLAKDVGMPTLTESLPYTPERLQAMVDLLNVDTSSLMMPSPAVTAPGGDDDDEGDDSGTAAVPPNTAGEFQAFDGQNMKFDHKCPRCSFEFNDPKA